MIKMLDRNGNLPPTIRGLIIIAAFVLGNITGWFGHINYALRGEAAQIVEDMEVGDAINKEADTKFSQLRNNIEEAKNDPKLTQKDCLDTSSPDYVRSLRKRLREEEF